MSEQPEEQKPENSKPPVSIIVNLKRIGLAIIFLVVVTQIIGRQFPNLMPSKTIEKTPEKVITKIAEQSIDKTETTIEEKTEPVIQTTVSPLVEPPQNDERIRSLEEKIEKLEAAHKTAISELEARITTENSTAQSKTESIVFALVAFEQLKEAVKNGEAYSEQLNILKKLSADKPEAEEIINTLEYNSVSGVKNPTKLKIEFSPLIKQILTNKSENIFLQTLHKFITIRKIGEQKGDDDESVLARVELKLAQGDLTSSLHEVAKLSPAAQEIIKNWIEGVNTWLSTQQNIDKLQLLLAKTEPALKP